MGSGAELDAVDCRSSQSALTIAALRGHQATVELLLQANADVSSVLQMRVDMSGVLRMREENPFCIFCDAYDHLCPV